MFFQVNFLSRINSRHFACLKIFLYYFGSLVKFLFINDVIQFIIIYLNIPVLKPNILEDFLILLQNRCYYYYIFCKYHCHVWNSSYVCNIYTDLYIFLCSIFK